MHGKALRGTQSGNANQVRSAVFPLSARRLLRGGQAVTARTSPRAARTARMETSELRMGQAFLCLI